MDGMVLLAYVFKWTPDVINGLTIEAFGEWVMKANEINSKELKSFDLQYNQ